MNAILVAAVIVALISIIPLVAFILNYAVKRDEDTGKFRYTTRWRSTQIGKTMVYMNIAWIANIGLFTLDSISPGSPASPLLHLILASITLLLFWSKVDALRDAQRRPRDTSVD